VSVGPKVFTCALCGGQFVQPDWWTDDDAEAEYRRNFSDEERATPGRAEVCTPCYRVIMAAAPHLDP
jgi:hypothetical protein